jgi:hypothetical protein
MIDGRLFAFPSPLNGERVRVRGGNFVSIWQKEEAAERAHPSPSIPSMNRETFNIQHSTPKVEGWREAKRLEGSKLGVEC